MKVGKPKFTNRRDKTGCMATLRIACIFFHVIINPPRRFNTFYNIYIFGGCNIFLQFSNKRIVTMFTHEIHY